VTDIANNTNPLTLAASAGVLTVQTEKTISIEGSGYSLHISRQKPEMDLILNGRRVATLNIASALDTLDAPDEISHLGAPSYYKEPEGVAVIWRGSSERWASKQIELKAWAEGFSYGYSVEGEGQIDRAHFFRTTGTASVGHDLYLFNPEPNSGSVQYTGQECTPGKHCIMCNPDEKTGEILYKGPKDFTTISVGKDRDFHEGNWFFTPSPFCYAMQGEGNWLAMGLVARPGEWNFSDMAYPGNGFGFSVVYDGHAEVRGKWESPRLFCLPAQDEYAAVQRYCDTLRELELVPTHGRGPAQDWWQEPIFCGWGEQVSQEVHFGLPKAFFRSTQENYERWLSTLEKHEINPGTVVLDDKWQNSYGLNDAHPEHWPDIKGFIAGQHAKGRHVLLWLKAWDAEGVPPEECIRDSAGKPVAVDPGNPAFQARFKEQIRRMLQDWDADGFKIDFTHLIPRGKGMKSAGGRWGLELMRQWLEILSEAARAAKPDALVMAHTANPYLADLVDMLRLNDVAGLINIKQSIQPDMRHRARIARMASPFWLLDADNWPCSSMEQWRDYVKAQGTLEFGVPSLYHAERLGWNITDTELTEEDYAAIRESWAAYRSRRQIEKKQNLRRKVGQLIMVEIPGTKMTPEIEEFVRECHPAGVALFARNLAGPWEAAQLVTDLQRVAQEAGDAPLLVGMDQEGGQVSHLRYPCTEMPSHMARVAAGGPETAGEAAEILGREMARLGINLAFAPVMDVNTNPNNPVISTRAFSDDPELVAKCGVAAIEGMRRAGVLSMAKHFPGHGDTSSDSHYDLPVITHDWERLRKVELKPFLAAIEAGVEAICSAHVIYSGIDDSGLPATLSRKLMTDLLRGELGYKGVLFSDAMVMEAVSKGKAMNLAPATIQAVMAGVDCVMLLGKLDWQRQCYEALLTAVEDGIIPEERLNEAVERVKQLRARAFLPDPNATWPIMNHHKAAQRLAREAVTLLRDEQKLLPLSGPGLGVIEFASGSVSPVESSRNEPIGTSTLAFILGHSRPDAQFLALHSKAPKATAMLDTFLDGCERFVVATRSAILDPGQAALLKRVVATGKPVIQLALRSPYDATLCPEIGTVILTYGDQPSGVSAAVDVLLGYLKPTGQLPIKL
jgi:beta-N-acetylhexosaminidase